jgi:hypothetical protein
VSQPLLTLLPGDAYNPATILVDPMALTHFAIGRQSFPQRFQQFRRGPNGFPFENLSDGPWTSLLVNQTTAETNHCRAEITRQSPTVPFQANGDD